MGLPTTRPGGRSIDPRPLLLTTEAALDAGLAALAALDPAGCATLLRVGGRPALRTGRTGFEGLAATITAQQVSTASAAAIFGRLATALVPLEAATMLAASDTLLREVGLSIAKVRTLRAAAAAVVDGRLPLAGFGALPVTTARKQLLAIKGIGPWTADVFLLFCRGEPDSFPAGDLALQEAYRLVFGGERRPSAAELEGLAERWRPWRGVAAYLLWSCYRALRGARSSPVPTAA